MTTLNASNWAEGADLTAFPRIEAPYTSGIVPGSEGTSRECLVLSWAMLLRSYVAGDVVSFTVDTDVVTVNFISGVVERLSSSTGGMMIDRKGSAVYYSSMPPTSTLLPSIYVYLDPDEPSKACKIAASQQLLPANHLPTLCSQLACIIQSKPISPLAQTTSLEPDDIGRSAMSNNGLSILNHPAQFLPGPSLLHELVLCSPTAERVGYSQQALDFLPPEGGVRQNFTYSDLETLSTRFAQRLLLQPGSNIIPVLLPQSPKLYVALLGILKAGAAFAPLPLDAPVDRIKFVVGDVGAQIVVADRSFKSKLSWDGCPRVIFVDEEDIDIASIDKLGTEIRNTTTIHPNSPAYVMYTSGSTGTPKGVIISHSAATQSLLAHEKHIPAYHRFLQFASPSFDVFVFEVFFTFFRGATLIGCERSRLLSDIVGVINKMDVDALELTPTVLGELVVTRDRIPKVQVVLTIGEMLTRPIVDEFGDAILHGMYGPTEAAIHCTLAPNFRKGGSVGDVGIPLDTVSAFIVGPVVLGQDITVLPIGWIGELAVGGNQLADGYLNRLEQTKEVFIDTRYGRLYRTGDRARMHPSGTIECFGRNSTGQVKLRGQRIELGEVEEAIRKIQGVKGAVASVISGSLVAFIGCESHVTDTVVREAVKKWLPGYMVPNTVITMTEIPKLSSGKADRKRLEKEYTEQRTQGAAHKTDDVMSKMEKTIAAAVMDILTGIEVSRESSFVASGLDSLLAIRLCSKLRESGLVTEVADILRTDCIKELACFINSHPGDKPSTDTSIQTEQRFQDVRTAGRSRILELSCLDIEDVEDIIPCTPLQDTMLSETMRDSSVYCNWYLLEIPSSYSDHSIELAFRKLILRNEILRTGFLHLGQVLGTFAQIVWDSPREGQFATAETVDKLQRFSVEDMINPPFKAFLIRQETSVKLSIHIHHALYDGWSWDHILRDLNRFLMKGQNGFVSKRPQFREVVRYNLHKDETRLNRSTAFWKEALADAPNSKLPNFYGYSGVEQSTSTEKMQLQVSRIDLERSARELGISPQVILQTSWAYLLSTYLQSSDVLFGTVISGRTIPLPGIEEVIGPCISTLPLRVRLGDKTKSCAELMRDVHEFNRSLLIYGDLDLRQIKKYCGVGSGAFDTLLIWQQTTLEREDEAVCPIKQVDGLDRLEFSLLLEAEPSDDTIILRATYKADILPHTQLNTLLSQLDRAVSSIVDSPFITLNTLSSGFGECLLSIQNPNPMVPSIENTPTLVQLVEATATQRPNAVAIEFAHELQDNNLHKDRLSYAELNAASNALAHKLLFEGAVANELICVVMEKSPMLYVSILAILKSGAAYLPLTPDTPTERVDTILSDARVQICLTTHDTRSRFRFSSVSRVISVDSIGLEGFSSHNPNIDIDPSSLAYAVYTSGSTGVPKGVLVTHQNITTNVMALKKIYPYTDTSRLLQFCSQAFDVSVFDIFFTWATGMCLCSGTKDSLLRDLEGIINAFEITHLSLTPTVAALIDSDNVPTVKLLVTAGEAVSAKVFKNWAGRGLYQGYGPSETTNICTMNAAMTPKHHINNLGPTLENTSAFVLALHDGFELIPRGGVGELCFGGSQVGRGYLNMPQLTSRKFISHPRYGTIYRSGDLGRLLPDGCIEFVGRKDDQVKIRGLRVELGEINSILHQQEFISDATTITITGSDSNTVKIISFVVPQGYASTERPFEILQPGPELSRFISKAFQTMSSRLCSYMVPANIVPISKLPMTHQGKINKVALQQCYRAIDHNKFVPFDVESSAVDGSGYWTSTERELAKLIAQLAKVPIMEIERSTSIYRLGLDSISAIHLSGQIANLGYKRPEVSHIMQHPTVVGLAAFLDNNTVMNEQSISAADDSLQNFTNAVKGEVLAELGLTDSQITTILPCTHMQEAMLTERAGENAASYYNHTVFKLRADPSKIKNAWSMAVNRNDILRTCFCVTSHNKHAYAQAVLKGYTLPWREISVQNDEDMMVTVNELIDATSSVLSSGRPPYGFTLLKSATQNILLMSTHHSLYDGFAMDLLLEEIQMTYNGIQVPIRPAFSSVLQFIESCDMSKADTFWKAVMDGFETVQFPDLTGRSTDYKANLTGMATRNLRVSRRLSSIEDGCKLLSTSLLALGQGAWARLLASYTGEVDICFGNVVSGRTIPVPGIENVIAPCFNTIPVRIQVAPGTTNHKLMEILQRANVEALPFQLTPLRRIMSTLQVQGQTLFDTLFILQYGRESSTEDLWEVIDDKGDMDFAVVLEIVPKRQSDSLELVLHFRRVVMNEEIAEIILRQLERILCSCIESPDADIGDYTFLENELLSISNSSPIELPEVADTLLHTMFEKRAMEDPSSTALEFLEDDGTISKYSYEALNKAANQVAHKLLQYGISRDEAVPICLEKSPQYYISVLGTLKAGSAFTPIDPSAPLQRNAFMMKELGARFAITKSCHVKDLPRQDGLRFIILEELDQECLQITNPTVKDLSPGNLAYRLYTSGSTGLPKAVSIEIQSALQTIRASKNIILWKNESRILQFAAITFDMCYYDCFMAWNYGFVLCSAGKKWLLGDLEDTINRMNITMLDLTPTVASTLSPHNLPEVELLYCIGEAMPPNLVKDWEKRCVNSYGPTEAAMCCTIVSVDQEIKSANIGIPFPTVSFRILSPKSTHPIPKLGCGELCIGGPQLAREYHNNSQLTNEKFITMNSQKLYRTGDNVRMLENGTFEFIGRLDDQVKIRGLRVELDEINSVIKHSHDELKEVATIVSQHSAGAKEQLVAFLAVGNGRNQNAVPMIIEDMQRKERLIPAARNAAERALPTYMIPGVMIIVDHIPLSAAGKVDKKILKILFSQQNVDSLNEFATTDVREEWSEEEIIIRKVLAEISQQPVESISKSSTIYQIGLDSISAAQVAMSLRKKGLMVTVLDILECPSIKQLSTRIYTKPASVQSKEKARQSLFLTSFASRFTKPLVAEYALSPDHIVSVYPCTAMQAGMLSQFLRSGGGLYFNHYLYQLSSTVDVQLLRDAWTKVMQENDMLRAGFYGIDDEEFPFASVIYTKNSFELPWTLITTDDDVSHCSLIQKQKSFLTSQAAKDLGIPPWHLSLFVTNDSSQLLLSAHHALYDAQSLRMILEAVTSYYLGNTAVQGSNFTGPLGKILVDADDATRIEAIRSFWVKRLDGTTISRFPSLTPTRIQSQNSHVTEHCSAWKLSHIEALSKDLGFSTHAVAQAAWARVLSAYLGEPQVCFGVVLSGRTGIPDAETAIFPFVTTVPAQCTVVGSNDDLVKRVQDDIVKVLPYQHTPLRFIQRWLGHPDQSLFDSIFVYQKSALGEVDNTTPLWNTVEEIGYVDYSVSIEIVPSAGGYLTYRATCRDSVLPLEQSKLLLKQIDAALINILDYPQDECTEFSQFPDALLSIMPPAEHEIPTDVTFVHQFVEKHCDLIPDKIALEFATSISKHCVEKQQWTYKQLDMEANKIANFLIQYGMKTGDLVGICFDKSADASFAIIGILKAGCGYVALDPTAPIDRKAFIVKDSGAQCILTMARFAQELRERNEVRVFVVGEKEIQGSSTIRPYVKDLTTSSRCYCLYTSGTTGTPKGCEITHENTVQAMLAFQRLFKGHWDEESRFLQFASFHFDVSVLEQFWSWSVGICVTSTPRDLLFEDLSLAISKLEITHLDLTPSLAALLNPEEVPSLLRGVFIVGGEALKQDVLDAWGRHGVLHNGYGPTEVTIGCTMLPRVPQDGKPSNIGPQFDNVGSFVMIPNTNRPTLKGAVGELCVSGKLVGKGYLNRPDLTREKFQYLEKYNNRIYRTGDLVRILYNGCFDFLGRADDQVKLRGQRLEIGEINATIKKADPSVKAVVTLVLRHPKQQRDQLVSFISVDCAHSDKLMNNHSAKSSPVLITTGEYSHLISVLLDACKKYLPVYMVPTHFLPLSEIPLSVNNKVDNKQLLQIYQGASLEVLQSLARRDEEVGELSAVGTRIQAILAEMTKLQSQEVKSSSTIFELGLDSVSVVALARRLKKNGFHMATVSMIMQNSTIGKLAQVLSKNTSIGNTFANDLENINQRLLAFSSKNSFEVCEHLGIMPDTVQKILPCSPLQEGMILRFIDSDDSPYFVSFILEITANINIEKLKEAWAAVINSTDILRTCFCATADGYAQIIRKSTNVNWAIVDIPQDHQLDEFMANEKNKLARLNRDLREPPIYFTVFRTPSRVLLALNIFHALYDGNSIPLLLRDVEDAYCHQYKPRLCQFPDVMPYILACDLKEAEIFWKGHLKLRRFIPLPRSENDTTEDCIIQLPINVSGSMLDEGCKVYNCTTQSLVQAAWATVLASYIGTDVNFGVVVSGRTLPLENIEDTIGPVFNTVPCFLQPSSSRTWRGLVGQAHAFNSESIPYHHTPLRLIRKWLSLSPGKAIFEALFIYQKVSDDSETDSALWKSLESNVDIDFPLSVEVKQMSNGELTIALSARGDVLSKERALDLVTNMERALVELLSDPDSTPIAIPNPTTTAVLSHPKTRESNGYYGHFEWTSDALAIRRTVSILTGLDVSEVSENASIFELGLDSIETIKLSARLRQDGIQIPVSTIMRNPTIKKLISYLETASVQPQEVRDDTSLLQFQKQARIQFAENVIEAIYPTTPLQEAIIAETIRSHYKFYFNHDVLKLDESVNLERLRHAWEMVIQNNTILRTSFFQVYELGIVSSHAFGQVVHKEFQVPWAEYTLSVADDEWHKVQEFIKQSTKAANLLQKPPLQLTVVKGRSSRYLILSLSHALYDGWSLGLLHEDVHRAYYNSLVPRPSPVSLLEGILMNNMEASSRFWKHILAGAQTSEFPDLCSSANVNTQTYRSSLVSKIDHSTAAAFCKRLGITAQTLGQTCWGLVLAHYTRSSDVVFGTVLSGRDTEDAEKMMFPTMNTVPVRVIAHGSYRTMFQYMQDNSGKVLKHQYTPLRMIQKLVNQGSKRLFDTLFIYQRGHVGGMPLQKLYQSVQSSSDIEYNICMELEREENNLIWRTACKSTVMASEKVDAMLQTLDSLLCHVIENPDFPAISYEDDKMKIGNTNPVQINRYLLGRITENQDESVGVVLSARGEWTPLEMKVRKVLAACSQVPEEEIERSQSIFHLGLDSISAIQVSSELRKEGILLGVAELLRNATVEKISRAAAGKMQESDAPIIVIDTNKALANTLAGINTTTLLERKGFRESNLERIMPAAPGQIYMLSIWQNTNGTLFMPTFSFKSKLLDTERLKAAWQMLVIEESILRTTFISTEIQDIPILQLVFSEVQAQFEFQEMPASSNVENLVSLEVSQQKKKAVSLNFPPVRLRLINTGIESLVFLSIHHALYDGVSIPLLLNRLREIYNSVPRVSKTTIKQADAFGEIESCPPPLSAPTAIPIKFQKSPRVQPSFADIVAYISSRDRFKQETFWSNYLDGARSTLLFSRSTTNDFNCTSEERTSMFNPALCSSSTALEEQCRKQGITLQTLILASFSKVFSEFLFPEQGSDDSSLAVSGATSPHSSSLSDYSPTLNQDIVIGVYFSNRHLPIDPVSNLYDIAAPTLNLLPLRVRSPRSTDLNKLAMDIQQDLAAINNPENSAGVSVADVERWTRGRQDLGSEGLKVDVWFNYLRLPGAGKDLFVDSNRDGDMEIQDSWTLLEEVKPRLPATAAEAVELFKSHSAMEKSESLTLPKVGDDMLDTNTARNHIMNNLDIEVSITGGNLGLGIFARRDLMDWKEAEKMMRDMGEMIKKAF